MTGEATGPGASRGPHFVACRGSYQEPTETRRGVLQHRTEGRCPVCQRWVTLFRRKGTLGRHAEDVKPHAMTGVRLPGESEKPTERPIDGTKIE
jgi:hypothetical protein